MTTAAGMGGQPWLVSFSGMAQVMGWTHRPPLVAPCSRSAILQAWQPHCRAYLPLQRFIPFHAVRSMSPADFVRALAEDLQACLSRCPQPAAVLQDLTAQFPKIGHPLPSRPWAMTPTCFSGHARSHPHMDVMLGRPWV